MKGKTTKKAKTGLAAGLICIALVGTTAFANGDPYTTYKEAVYNTAVTQNMTAEVQMELLKNGTTIAEGTMIESTDGTSDYSSMTGQINGKAINVEESDDGKQEIARINDSYVSYTDQGNNNQDEEDDENIGPNTKKLANMVVDLFVGDVKNQFTTDGSTISLSLEGAQIPEIANTALSASLEMENRDNENRNQDADEEENSIEKEAVDVENEMENLVSDLTEASIKSINMTAQVEKDNIKTNTFDIVITGKDQAGNTVEYQIKLDVELSDIGSTTVKTIDTTGKTVKELKGSEEFDD